VLGIDIGKSSGCAPETIDLTRALAATTDIELGEAAVGDGATDGLVDTEVLGLVEPHAANSEPITTATATETLRLSMR
jgi:hypothetical protein